MPNTTPPLDLARRIQHLLDRRQQHLSALAEIDQTLGRINAVLKPGAAPAKASAASPQKAAPAKKGRRKARTFKTTGDESVLAFIRQHKNPTSQEIERHWKGEGRGGAAANVLTKLYQEKRVKREPMKDQRGSRYTVA